MTLEDVTAVYREILINRLANALAPAYAKGHIVAAFEAKMHNEDTRLIKPTRAMFLDRLRPQLVPILAYYDRFADSLISRIEEELEAGDDPGAVASRLRGDVNRLIGEEYVEW